MKKNLKKLFYLFILAMLVYAPNAMAAITCSSNNGDLLMTTDSGKTITIGGQIPNTVHIIIMIIKILVPVLLVVFGMIDLAKGITAQKEDEIKKGQQIFIKRLIAGLIIFFVFTIVQLVINFASDDDDGSIMKCANCFINGMNKCGSSSNGNGGNGGNNGGNPINPNGNGDEKVGTITYNANGHCASNTPQSVTAYIWNDVSLVTMDCSGYIFEGWCTNQDGTGTCYSPKMNYAANPIKKAGEEPFDLTLYAQWSEDILGKTATLTYDSNGKCVSGTPAKVTMNYTDPVYLTTMSCSGYTFEGWCTDKNGKETCYSPKMNYTANPIKKENTAPTGMTLYAQWTANSYTVKLYYNVVNAPGSLDKTVTVTSGSTNNNTVAAPKNTGHSFKGYYTSSTGGKRVYGSDGKYDSGFKCWSSDGKWQCSEGYTLYAQWQ